MGKTLLFFMVLSVKLTFAQVNDNFLDGDYTTNPIWKGGTYFYTVNAAKQLQTVSRSSAQTVSLFTANQLAINTKWEFYVQLNFDPSSSNQAKIYLISDQQDLAGPLNGYFIQIGESGSADSYDLYKQSGATVSKIIDGPPKIRTDVNKLLARISVTRNDLGKWELYTDITGANNYTLEGTTTDLTFLDTDWFGISCTYTATRADGFIFDDFLVDELTPDITPPVLLSAKVIDEFTIEAIFSERLDLDQALLPFNYLIPGLGNPTLISVTSSPRIFHISYAASLPSGDYQLTVKNVKDLKGNLMTSKNTANFFYLKPYELKQGDLMISEILVNPKNGGVDFVEIYNHTNQILDLSALQLANMDANGNIANIKNVSVLPVYMPAKSYWVLTTNISLIKQNYKVKFDDQFVQMGSLPSYNNDKGTVVLCHKKELLERFDYTEKMHIALLQDANGVSLERVSFNHSANEQGNFTSAAATSGFATPTFRNSQEEDRTLTKNRINLISKTFSPDGDGFEDVLQIDYQFITNGNLATINIYNDRGILVRKLERNTTIATAGSFIWDGLNDVGQLSSVGIYLIKFDSFALNGKIESFKQTCVLAAKLN